MGDCIELGAYPNEGKNGSISSDGLEIAFFNPDPRH